MTEQEYLRKRDSLWGRIEMLKDMQRDLETLYCEHILKLEHLQDEYYGKEGK